MKIWNLVQNLLLFTSVIQQFIDSNADSSFPPLPILPIPSAKQLRFQSRRLSMFFHFGVNTFTDSERGSGREDPSIFNPESLNVSQWMEAAQGAGAELVILTVKHHDGFCLWPSAYTNFSVASSSWRSGGGDLLAEFVSAARDLNLDVGLYLSPWDLHESCYGDTTLYNEFFLAQLREILTRYGRISEVWLDGAKSEDARDMRYMFNRWFETIHQLQPEANIFSDAGPDVRWVGNEWGEAGNTCWSMVNRSSITIGKSEGECLMSGEITGINWIPPECDISIRPGWFWHRREKPKSVAELLEIYYKSAGRNCLLLLNVPPNSSGVVEDEDMQVLKQFGSALDTIFARNVAANSSVVASSVRGEKFGAGNVLEKEMNTYWAPGAGEVSGWLEIDLGSDLEFNVVEIGEPVSMGQRIKEFDVEVWDGDGWRWIAGGTTIGFRKLCRLHKPVSGRVIRLVIHDARADPLVCFFGLYSDTFSGTTLSSKAFEFAKRK